MTLLSDAELAAFVATSAAFLGFQLDDQALTAVLDAMQGVISQAALVLDYPTAPTAP